MRTVAACLRDIEKVRHVATGVEQAYLARSRLSRLVLRATSMARRAMASTPAPTPEAALGTADEDGRVKQILRVCGRLDAARRSATHASEPLDERWRTMWVEIESDLDELQGLLEEYNRTHR